MQKAADILKDLDNLYSSARKGKNISPETEKRSKGMGGILVPNAFQVPNEIIDEGHLAKLNGAELKVLLYIIRKTFGYNKITGDRIPLSQLMNGTRNSHHDPNDPNSKEYIDLGTGLSKRGCIDAVETLERVGLIEVIRGESEDGQRKINYYRLATRDDYNKPRQ